MSLGDFTPHGFCLDWDPGLIWLQAGSDLLIATAYYSIPAALIVFLRRRSDLAFKPIFALFAAFILLCGTTHIMGVVTLWKPFYWLDGFIKAITAVVSIATAILLWPLLPKALALPSPESLRQLNQELARQVAERDDVAAKLLESQAELRRLYAHSPAILHALTPRGQIVEVSDRWLELFGYERHEVIGKNITSFYTPETREQVLAHLADLSAGHGELKAERCLLTKGGTRRDAEATFEVERDSEGRITIFLAALTDVTARKAAEKALRASEEKLRHAQKMEAVGQLTGGIAHDFNNLLTTVMGSLELVQRRSSLDERSQRLIGNALDSAKRAAKLTSQLLSFSRAQRLQTEILSPEATVNGIREILAQSVSDRAELVIEPPQSPLWYMKADRNQLEVALLNLAINARDAIEGHGAVTISFASYDITADLSDTFGPDTLEPGAYIGIAVRDTGTGMTPDVMARAFEPFFTTKPPGSGTGLGLAQTYGFARQSGGTVRLESIVGHGTTVEILLPAAPPQRDICSGDLAEIAEARGHGETILFVEDDPSLRLTISEALRELGYRVLTAEDGPTALAALDGGIPIDLLFTDVMMPGGLHGVDVAKAARSRLPNLRVLFATGFSDRHILAQWPEEMDLLQKPYELRFLAERIATQLKCQATTRSAAG